MTNTPIDILIVTALPEELEAISAYLPDENKIHSEHCDLTYQIGSLEIVEGVFYSYGITCLYQMGNTHSSMSAAHAIRDLSPRYIFMFGIAAGVKERVNLADVIVNSNIFYYELAKLHPNRIETRPQSYQADAFVSNKMKDFVASFDAEYEVKFGPFAAGEKVVADSQEVERLMEFEPKLLGVEMESYGVASAAAKATIRPRFIAIRGVSDFADEDKDDKWRDKALKNAAEFFVSFLKEGVLPKEETFLTNLDIAQSLIAVHHLSLNKRASLVYTLGQQIPDYRDFEINELVIDQTDLYSDGSLTAPSEALKRQIGIIHRLNDLYDRYPQASVGYFGLAHIPLLFQAGYQINRRVIKLFTTDRQTSEWLPLMQTGTGSRLHLEENSDGPSEDAGDITIRISISYSVREQQIKGIVNNPLASFHLFLANPQPDVVTREKQLDRYARIFHKLLVDINARFPNTQQIHLFMSAPPQVVFKFGQQVSKTIYPDTLIYNFSVKDQPNYGWAINIMADKVIEFRNKEKII